MFNLKTKIFAAVAKIPSGQVVTYKALAARVGCQSVRAVASYLKLSANYIGKRKKTNQLIPCHRVIRSDGRVGKYFGSLSREKDKALKLKQEGVRIKKLDGKFYVVNPQIT